MIIKTQPFQIYGILQMQSLEEFNSNTGLLQKEEKSQIDNLTHYQKRIRKEEQTKAKVSRRKEIKDQRGNQ